VPKVFRQDFISEQYQVLDDEALVILVPRNDMLKIRALYRLTRYFQNLEGLKQERGNGLTGSASRVGLD
jgi:hypothetical protein